MGAIMNKNILCCCGGSYSSAARVERSISVISHARLQLEQDHKKTYFLTTPDELDITELSVLRRWSHLAVQAEEIYAQRSPRKYIILDSAGDKVEDFELDAADPFEAAEKALTESSEFTVSEFEE